MCTVDEKLACLLHNWMLVAGLPPAIRWIG